MVAIPDSPSRPEPVVSELLWRDRRAAGRWGCYYTGVNCTDRQRDDYKSTGARRHCGNEKWAKAKIGDFDN
jgi:hypothetical protein